MLDPDYGNKNFISLCKDTWKRYKDSDTKEGESETNLTRIVFLPTEPQYNTLNYQTHHQH